MISYDTKEWLGALRLHRADTFRRLWPATLLLCIYTAAIVLIETRWLQLSAKSSIQNVPLMHGLLGFAISMLLVFRTNTAYDRWWEGRKQWGALVNVSRNIALKFKFMLPQNDKQGREFFATTLSRFAVSLMHHLRSQAVKFELDENPHPEIPDLDTARHVPAQITGLIYAKAMQLYRDGVISGEQLITVSTDITALMDICGACERIRNTPIPYSYSAFIKKFIVVYVVTLPLGYVFSLDFLAVPIVAFIFYVLASLELIAEDIEEPFGTDTDDLPMERLCATIDHTVRDILEG